MTDMTITGLDDATIARLRARAQVRNITVEALARETLGSTLPLTVAEKMEIVAQMQQWSRRVRNPGVPQTLGVDLIRESRDLDR